MELTTRETNVLVSALEALTEMEFPFSEWGVSADEVDDLTERLRSYLPMEIAR